MAIYDGIYSRFPVQTAGEVDYVANGNVYTKVEVKSVLIGSQSDLASLTGYTPGTIAHTAGFANMWELDVDGTTWVSLMGEG